LPGAIAVVEDLNNFEAYIEPEPEKAPVSVGE
jgi:hypothetical protein